MSQVAGPHAASPGPDEVPRVAVVGCGYWGKNLVRNFAALGALGYVCDSDPAVAQRLAAEFSVESATFDEVLGHSDIQGVVIATPAEMHHKMALEALDRGKHVFVEKPLALDVAEADALCTVAERQGSILMVGHLMQYHPAFVELERMVHAGELGRIQYVYSNRLNLGKFRREENILWSFAPHDISMILGLIGDEPDEVVAVGGKYLHQQIADVTTTHLSFPGGEKAHVFVSWLHPFKEQKLVVVADRGMAVFDDGEPWESKLQVFRHRVDWRRGKPEPVRATSENATLKEDEPLSIECRAFLEAVASGRAPRTDGREGVRVLRVLQAAERSMTTGATTRVEAAGGETKPFFVHPSTYVDDDVEIGPGTRVWHFSHLLPGTRIGADCNIGQNVMIGPDVEVGARCKIQNNVSLYKGVLLEDDVFCGPSCVFTNVKTPRAEVNRREELGSTVVRRGATIGANATIVCGHEIGAYSLVAAGAVVTADVPPHALMAGVPARQIGWVSHAGERLGDDLVCPRTGRRYFVTEAGSLQESRD